MKDKNPNDNDDNSSGTFFGHSYYIELAPLESEADKFASIRTGLQSNPAAQGVALKNYTCLEEEEKQRYLQAEPEEIQFTRLRCSMHSIFDTVKIDAVKELAHFDSDKKDRFNAWVMPRSPRQAVAIDWDQDNSLPGIVPESSQASSSSNSNNSVKVATPQKRHPSDNLKKQAILSNAYKMHKAKKSQDSEQDEKLTCTNCVIL